MPEAGRTLSVSPVIDSGARVMQRLTEFPSPGYTSNMLHLAKCKEILWALSEPQQEYAEYYGVSHGDYAYIVDRLACHEHQKMRIKLTFFPCSQHLMALSPLPVHESILCEISKMLTKVLATMPISKKILNQTVTANMPFIGHSLKERQRWIMECAFSQRDEDATQRLQQYIDDDCDLLVVGKIVIKQASTYHSPGSDDATHLRLAPLMTFSEWLELRSDEDEYGQVEVEVDGFTWFSLSRVEIHLWVRLPSNSAIDLDHLDGNSYASGTLYPIINLDDVNRMFLKGLLRIQDAIVFKLTAMGEDIMLVDAMESWSPLVELMDLDRE
ncbi:hypothetical protein SCLCIDRAFT_26582 [Scleroderma citrinum Foug A]|uniref:Uncharacterized protein n=1 Tax=Scleroderma citrinum Foug A TaxID=1036808 RepID=A0A0C2ZFT4_9AGAM|nr:hypothetical protein SCLCIDRAFT_26582 [Scleroderma citrinum Foug A]